MFWRVGVKERWCGYSEVYGIGKQWVGTFGAINISELTLDSLGIISRGDFRLYSEEMTWGF